MQYCALFREQISVPDPLTGEEYAIMGTFKTEPGDVQLGRIRQGVFIERDGILNHAREGTLGQISPLTMKDFRVKEEAVPLVKRLKAAGLTVIATTNQPGLSRGHQSRGDLDRMHELLRATFDLDDIMVCPHDEAHPCFCRHPKPGLLVEGGFKWRLNLDHCYVVSDKWQDAEAARSVGCTSLLVSSPWAGRVHRDFLGPDLATVVDRILQLQTSHGVSLA